MILRSINYYRARKDWLLLQSEQKINRERKIARVLSILSIDWKGNEKLYELGLERWIKI